MSSTPENGKQSRSGRKIKPTEKAAAGEINTQKTKKPRIDNSSGQGAAVEADQSLLEEVWVNGAVNFNADVPDHGGDEVIPAGDDTEEDDSIDKGQESSSDIKQQDAEARIDTQDTRQGAEGGEGSPNAKTQDPKQDAKVQTDEQGEGGEGSPEACVKCAGLEEECATLKQQNKELDERILQLTLRVKAAEGAYHRVATQVEYLQKEIDNERPAKKGNTVTKNNEPFVDSSTNNAYDAKAWMTAKKFMGGSEISKIEAILLALSLIAECDKAFPLADNGEMTQKQLNAERRSKGQVFRILRTLKARMGENKEKAKEWVGAQKNSAKLSSAVSLSRILVALVNHFRPEEEEDLGDDEEENDSRNKGKKKSAIAKDDEVDLDYLTQALNDYCIPHFYSLFEKAEEFMDQTKQLSTWTKNLFKKIKGSWDNDPVIRALLGEFKDNTSKVNVVQAFRTIKFHIQESEMEKDKKEETVEYVWKGLCDYADNCIERTGNMTTTRLFMENMKNFKDGSLTLEGMVEKFF